MTPPSTLSEHTRTGPLTASDVLAGMSDLVVVVDPGGHLEFVGDSARTVLGLDPTDWIGRDVIDLIHPDDIGLAVEAMVSSVESGPGAKIPLVLRVRDAVSQWRRMEIVASNVPGADGTDRLVVVARDLGRRAAFVADAEALARRFERAFDRAPIGMALVGADGRLVRVNEALEDMLGRTRTDLTGLPVLDLVHPGDAAAARRHAREVQRDDEVHAAELRFVRSDGSTGWAQVTSTALRDDRGRPEHTVIHLQDVTERNRLHQQLAYAATHDPLTGLLNRAGFEERFSTPGPSAARALVVVDLDRFKPVNDRLGHAAGDELLEVVARRLERVSTPGDSVGRLGGDEFAVLLADVDHLDRAAASAERIRSELARVVALRKGPVRVSGSVGVAVLEGPIDLDTALAAADRAAYEAKRGGGDDWSLTRVAAPPDGDPTA